MKVELENIGKRFRKEWIFRNVSRGLTAQNCTAILGSNGSGKSTLLQIISGYLTPSEGEIVWQHDEEKILREHVYRHTAICSPMIQLWDELTLEENISLFLRFKALPKCNDAAEFMACIQLQKQHNKPLKTFSSGMKQRVKLGLAILSDAQLLLLDEPCSHLDAAGVLWYQSLLTDNRKEKTVIIASNRDERETFLCEHRIEVRDESLTTDGRGATNR